MFAYLSQSFYKISGGLSKSDFSFKFQPYAAFYSLVVLCLKGSMLIECKLTI